MSMNEILIKATLAVLFSNVPEETITYKKLQLLWIAAQQACLDEIKDEIAEKKIQAILQNSGEA